MKEGLGPDGRKKKSGASSVANDLKPQQAQAQEGGIRRNRKEKSAVSFF